MTEPAAANPAAANVQPLFANAPEPAAPSPAEQKAADDARSAEVSERVKIDTADAIAKGYPDPTKSAPAPNEPRDAAAAAPKPAAGAERIKIGELELTAEEWQSVAARKAELDLQKATLPADPGGYEIKLPADFKAPVGVPEVEFMPDAPAVQSFREWAFKNGLTQTQFSEALGSILERP